MNWMLTATQPSLSRRLMTSGFAIAIGLLGYLWFKYPKVYIADRHSLEITRTHWVPFHQNGKFGYLDTEGNCRIKPRFDGADGFCEGMARVLLNGRFGFIDSSGQMVIPAEFAWASPFRGGYASVWNGSDWDYLDKNGQAIVIFPKESKRPQARSL